MAGAGRCLFATDTLACKPGQLKRPRLGENRCCNHPERINHKRRPRFKAAPSAGARTDTTPVQSQPSRADRLSFMSSKRLSRIPRQTLRTASGNMGSRTPSVPLVFCCSVSPSNAMQADQETARNKTMKRAFGLASPMFCTPLPLGGSFGLTDTVGVAVAGAMAARPVGRISTW